jgi:outer membrane immunogenic protein
MRLTPAAAHGTVAKGVMPAAFAAAWALGMLSVARAGGRRMKKLIFAGAFALIAATPPATAADIPIDAPLYRPAVVIFSWTGFYLGAHAGGGWARKDITALPFTLTGATIAGAPVGLGASGWLAGGQVGVNYQAGAFVFGAEAQASWAHLTGSAACPFTSTAAVTILAANCSAKVDALGTVAGRLGIALDRLLLYGKAGAAWANDKYNSLPTTTVLPALAFSANETRWGWMLGAGLEYAFIDNWSAKLEYNYMDFGTRGVRFVDTTGLLFLDTSIRERIQVVKVGINYRFGPSAVAVR